MIIGPMSQALGQQIIVENVTGAGGTIGANKVAKAKPDGYTIMVSGSGTHAAAEFLNKNLPYRSTDFAQIGLIMFRRWCWLRARRAGQFAEGLRRLSARQ